MSQVFGRNAVSEMIASAMAGLGAGFPLTAGKRDVVSGIAKRPPARAGDKLARTAQECRVGMPRGTTYVGATVTWPDSRAKAKKAEV